MSIMSGLRASVVKAVTPAAMSHDELMAHLATKRAGGEARLASAEEDHNRACLDAERGVPGAISRRAEAAQAVEEANAAIRDAMGAMLEAEAQERDRSFNARREEREGRFRAIEACLAKLEKKMPAIDRAAETLAREFGEVSLLESELYGLMGACGLGISEWATISRALPHLLAKHSVLRPGTNLGERILPPGAAVHFGEITGVRSLADELAGTKTMVERAVEKAREKLDAANPRARKSRGGRQ